MSVSLSASKVFSKKKTAAKIQRKSPLEQPVPAKLEKLEKVNQLKRRGYFAGQEIVDATRQHLEPNELKEFFKFLPPTSFWYPYFFIQYFYGCRLSEPALILDEDVSFKKKMIVIRRLKKAQEREGYREHVYAADQRILDCVTVALRWKEHKHIEENPFLFASSRRTKVVGAERLSQLRNLDGWQAVSRFTAHRMFQRIATHLKLPENLRHSHVLRHTRATLMLAAGASPEQVQFLLGHSSLKMTMRYIGVADSMRSKLNADVLKMGLGL